MCDHQIIKRNAQSNSNMGIPFLDRRRSPDTKDAKIRKLLQEVEELKLKNQQLQEQVQASGIILAEYLYKYREGALPLLGSEWELRYVVLDGNSIKYYKSDKDVVFNPREEIRVMGCVVLWDGRKSGRYWAFSVLDPAGNLLIRLATPSQPAAEKWVSALQACGCSRQEAAPGSKVYVARANSMPARPRSLSSPGQELGPRLSDVGPSSTQRTVTYPARISGLRVEEPEPSDSDVPVPAAMGPQVEDTADSSHSKHPHPTSQQLPMTGSTPLHTAVRFSYLSSERLWHEKHTGLYNLAGVVLVAANFRLALENALKYGWRFNPIRTLRELASGEGNLLVAACYPILVALCSLSLAVEVLGSHWLLADKKVVEALAKKDTPDEQIAARMRVRAQRREWLLFSCIAVITSSVIMIPWSFIFISKAEPLGAGVLFMLSVVCWMKLVSYHHCNYDLRLARQRNELLPGERGSPDTPADWGILQYPENLTVSNLAYYMAAPTLCYQPVPADQGQPLCHLLQHVNFPRTRSIRVKWLMRRVFEMLIVASVLTIIVHQYIEPTVINSIGPLRQMDWLRVAERVLKLALPNLYAWLCMFYLLFHLWLNILGELLRFGDRQFYKDWWNAPTLGEYWKTWNMPVHKWLLRHVYFPCIRLGLGRTWSMVLVFFVSAVFHELVLGVPLHMVRLWAFTGIMLQVPLVIISETIRRKLNRDDWGNYLFWVTFCVVGQPVSLLLYYHDYMLQIRPQLLNKGLLITPTPEVSNATSNLSAML